MLYVCLYMCTCTRLLVFIITERLFVSYNRLNLQIVRRSHIERQFLSKYNVYREFDFDLSMMRARVSKIEKDTVWYKHSQKKFISRNKILNCWRLTLENVRVYRVKKYIAKDFQNLRKMSRTVFAHVVNASINFTPYVYVLYFTSVSATFSKRMCIYVIFFPNESYQPSHTFHAHPSFNLDFLFPLCIHNNLSVTLAVFIHFLSAFVGIKIYISLYVYIHV